MIRKDDVLGIVREELEKARERADAEQNYLIHLQNTEVPENSGLFRTHKELETYYRGETVALQNLAIRLKAFLQ